MTDVDISRERIERLKAMGSADYIHIALLDKIDALAKERDELTDIVERLTKERDQALAANERWQKNSAETWEAMQTMRDAINEYIPMPSLESNLLQGPENSVFCAAVAEAVITGIQARAAAVAQSVEEARAQGCGYPCGYDCNGACFNPKAALASQKEANDD